MLQIKKDLPHFPVFVTYAIRHKFVTPDHSSRERDHYSRFLSNGATIFELSL